MIWKLFKPKPVFVLTIPRSLTTDEYDNTVLYYRGIMGKEYNIVIVTDTHKTYVETKILH